MNFFAHQEVARKQTRRMVVLFTLAVVCIVAAVNLAVLLALGIGLEDASAITEVSWQAVLAISIVVVLLIGLATLYRIASLRSGGTAVARQLGATEVPLDSNQFDYRRLRNVVEEIAIASGVPVPAIFVLEDESAINAFAAGYTPSDAAVAVTRGCLDKLTRDELQGVIAHEFSHVLNGDMRLNIRLMGVAFGILAIAIIGRKIAHVSSHSRSRDSGGVVMFGVALIVIGSVGVFFARLIKASVSRQREFLADASAVQFTRQTDGIAGALKKIGALGAGSKLDSADGEEVAHMLFGDGVGYSALFATHPPLVDRIKRLQPQFEPEQLEQIAAAWEHPVRIGKREQGNASVAGFAPAGGVATGTESSAHGALPEDAEEFSLSAEQVVNQVGHPDTGDFVAAAALSMTIPPLLDQAAHSRDGALAVVCALALNAGAQVRSQQLAAIVRAFDAGTAELTEELATYCAQLHPMQRLPLAALSFPALRSRPRDQLKALVDLLDQLSKADGKVTLAEYCLAKLLAIQVLDALDPATRRTSAGLKTPQVERELRDLYAILAHHGHGDAERARRAYALGLHEALPAARPDYSPPADWQAALDGALLKLDRLCPAGKELVVRGLTLVISADGRVRVSEAELLRTVCAALHCPLPPVLESTAGGAG